MHRLATLLLLSAACMSACGGGESPGPERGPSASATPAPDREVAEAVTAWANSTDPRVVCEQRATRAVIRDWYGGAEACEAGARGQAQEETTVGAVAVDGERATAQVRTRGADGSAAAQGTVEVVRDGGTWKVDRVRADYPQSILLQSAQQVDEGLLTAPGAKACVARGVRQLSGRQALSLVKASGSGRASRATRKRYVALFESCPSVLTDFVVERVVEATASVEDSPRYQRCVRRKLRTFADVPVLDLAQDALSGGSAFQAFASATGIACLPKPE